MVTEKLIINGVDVPLINGIGTVLTYSVTDIEQPDKRKASFSKTIKLPGSKVLNDLFNFIFEINSDSTFNPNLKATASYLIDDVKVFSGIIQLKKINKLDNEHYTYDVVLLGELADVFTELGDGDVDDVDMNWYELDHQDTFVNIQDSWATSYFLNGVSTPFSFGSGYTYPMINYSQDANNPQWDKNSFYPAAYAKEYIDRMFLAAGYEYDSTFFNTSYFKKLIIPFGGKEFTKNSLAMDSAIVNTSLPIFNTTGTTSSTSLDTFELIRFTNETQDIDNQHNTTNGVTTVALGNENAWSCNYYLDFKIEFDSGLAALSNMISTCELDLTMYVNNIAVDQVKGWVRHNPGLGLNFPPTGTPYLPIYDFEFLNQAVNLADLPDSQYTSIDATFRKYEIRLTSIQSLTVADEVTFKLKTRFIPDTGETNNFKDGAGNEATGSAVVTLNYLGNSQYENQPISTTYWGDYFIDMRSAIPKDIKKKDFFKSIIEMFNLYIEPDVDNPKVLKIEPRDNFYNANVNDWSSKLDVSKDIKYDMLAAKNKSKYIYAYKEDKDYYNEKHSTSWSRGYGDRHIDIINDFSKDEYKQEVIFSATPSVGDVFNDRIIPTIIGVDKDEQPLKLNSNIRILQYMGLISTGQQWQMVQMFSFGPLVVGSYNAYPYSGMWNSPFSPTEDLGFGLPKEIYWDNTFGAITVSNNNLYNKYHKKGLEELTNKDSKMVTAWFLLNPVDIYNLDFKSQYFFDNAYFRLQEVKYKPNSYEVSECKFLKLKTGAPFVPITGTLVGGWTGELTDEFIPGKTVLNGMSGYNLLDPKSVTVSGTNNVVNRNSSKIDIKGNLNKVFSSCENISISGDNNIIESNLKNVTLVNTSNVTVTESNTTYVNGEIKGAGSVITIDTNTTADESITTYLCDTSGGGFAVSLPSNPTIGKVWNFKKTDITNTIQLRATAPVLIDELSTKNITGLNNSFSVQFDGTNYKII